MGIVYLLQPPEFVGTTRYKIGCSKKNDLSRVRYYGKETWYILIMHCDNPYDIETELIKEFNINFKNIAKREWFEGNIDEMVKLFIEIFLKNKEPNEHTTYNITPFKKDIIQSDNTICQKPQEKQHHHSVMFMINMYCKLNENERNLFICPGNLLYNQYTKWCTTYNIKEPMTITMFGLKIPKYNGVIKKRTRSGIVYRIQFNELRNSFEKNDMWKTSEEE